MPRAKKQNLVLTTANSSVYKINLLLKTTGELFKLTFRSIGLPIRTTDEVRMTRAVDVTYALVLVMNSFAYSSKLTIQVLAWRRSVCKRKRQAMNIIRVCLYIFYTMVLVMNSFEYSFQLTIQALARQFVYKRKIQAEVTIRINPGSIYWYYIELLYILYMSLSLDDSRIDSRINKSQVH